MVLGNPFRRAFSIRLQRRYLIYNRGARFYSRLDTRRRWRKRLGSLLFKIQLPTRYGAAPLAKLEEELGDRVRDFLLYDTHDYKSTQWVGVVALEGDRELFVKIYKEKAAAAENALRSQKAAEIFAPYFGLSESSYFGGRVCAYSLLQKKRNVSIAEVEERVLERYAGAFSNPNAMNRDTGWFSEEDQARLSSHGFTICSVILQRAGTQAMWSHGDLSHWNCFFDRSGQLCLIDYEEVGIYPPLYDWFHLILKPSLLKPGCVFPAPAILGASRRFRLEETQLVAWLWLYLLLEIQKDLLRNQVLRSEKIQQEIEYKRILWEECRVRFHSR